MRSSAGRCVFSLLLGAFFFSAWPPALRSQEASPFSPINDNLKTLEALILDTLTSSETLTQQLAELKTNLSEQERLLSERETSILRQENLLNGLQRRLDEMSQLYGAQLTLSRQYESSSRFWKVFTLAGIPAAILLSAGITALLMAAR